MLSEFLWKTFENTGNIEAYLAFRQLTENREPDQKDWNNANMDAGNEITEME